MSIVTVMSDGQRRMYRNGPPPGTFLMGDFAPPSKPKPKGKPPAKPQPTANKATPTPKTTPKAGKPYNVVDVLGAELVERIAQRALAADAETKRKAAEAAAAAKVPSRVEVLCDSMDEHTARYAAGLDLAGAKKRAAVKFKPQPVD